MRRGRRAGEAITGLAISMLLGACTAAPVATPTFPPSAAQPSAATTDATSLQSSVPSATPSTAEGIAPPELAGTWRRIVLGEEVILTLGGTGYNIQRAGNIGSGSIEVDGTHVRFSGSTLCDGIGGYTWAIEDGRLRLTEIEAEADPCSGRTDVLLRGTFGRVEP